MADPEKKVRFFRLPNALRDKTGVGKGVAASISPELLSRAQQAIDKLSEDYPDWALAQVNALYDLHKKCVFSTEQRAARYRDIHRIAHDLKGQGGTFGYPLVSVFAESLYRMTDMQSKHTDTEIEMIKAHVDAIRVVIQSRLKDPDSDAGARLRRVLSAVVQKLR